MGTYHLKAQQILNYTIAVEANTKAEAIRKLKAAYEEGDFNPFLDHREDDNFYDEEILNYVIDGSDPIFEWSRKVAVE